MTTAYLTDAPRSTRLTLDPMGILVALVALAGLVLPFAIFKANRIVPGEGVLFWDALPLPPAAIGLAWIGLAAVLALLRIHPVIKLAASTSSFLVMALLIGMSSAHLTPPDNAYARIGVGAGFWLLAFALMLMLTDALARLRLGPSWRIGLLALAAVVLGALLWSGAWDGLSILKEYGSRAPAFWQEARTHVLLAFGSVFLAWAIGVPLGIVCYKITGLRAGALNLLNVVQTIPSIALFGVLIAPLAWVAANVPGASAIGISGIGIAPAMVALVAYALLPIVANTLVGLTGLPEATVEAARGMGMTWWQRLMRVELPLAFPVILTGIRIVLVQNIGLATIAALIGGGGFGVFVFQGVGQTAIDLVLLGAAPTVALAFAAAVLLDSLIELSSRRGKA
ncbi:osmoprotectant transport system permease protein [Devosia crocina]|uniref:Osmoprotectant transport system permease protein n=1 Tax=Devosia crocina TaxID=429728 RepID=A0A1I7NLD0_9HYPH|nr:ABC transporter permease [Devosia crocina]SFV35436.1 osmoprotectant transport system permease protein [Devosia crocina]